MSALASEDFWRANFPDLSIDAAPFDRIWASPGDSPAPSDMPRMTEDGYFQGRSGALADLAPRRADAVRIAVRLDVPLAFLFLFDEAWAAFAAIAPRLMPFLDDLRILPDFWSGTSRRAIRAGRRMSTRAAMRSAPTAGRCR